MCLKFKEEHAEDNTHSESLLHEKVSWYWLCSVQQRMMHSPIMSIQLDFCCPVRVGVKNKRDLHFSEIVSISISQECLCSEPTDCSL